MRVIVREYLADAREQMDFGRRADNYVVAQERLDKIASEWTNSKSRFEKSYFPLVAGAAKEGSFYSGSLIRRKNEVASQWRKVQELVRYVKDHPNLSAVDLFRGVKHLIAAIHGVGVNLATEIMATYYPDRCAVLNQNPRNSLQSLGLSKYPEPNNFTAGDYKRFLSDIHYLMKLAGFDTLGRADHFLNYIYWHHFKPKKH